MRVRSWPSSIAFLLLSLGGATAAAQPAGTGALPASAAAPAGGAAALPLRTVRLYEVGVGYFERSGRTGNGRGLALPVPPSHLDDALKTLVVLSKDGAKVSGIEFASSVSPAMGRALAGLPDGGGAITHQDLLRSLKGAGVEVRTAKEAVQGRLVDVLEPSQSDVTECAAVPAAADAGKAQGSRPCALEKRAALLLLTDRGEVRRMGIADVVAVRPTDPARAARIGAGLDAVSQSARAQQHLEILGSPGAEVTLGYVAEAPVWRPTYRMVLDAKSDRAVLQGWVLLHNDTDEAWRGVKVELVNGKPDSFLFPLAAPRYAHRELRTPAEPLHSVPQLMGKTVDGWSDGVGDSFGAGGLGLSGYGEGGGGRGEGIGLGNVGVLGSAHATGSSSLLSVGNLAATAPADGVESGALFRYALPQALDLRAHGSALVPFVQAPVSAGKVAWFDRPGADARSAARIANDTQQTLPAGTLSFFADGGFAGEAQLERMKPKDVVLIGFGADLDITLEELAHEQREEPKLVVFDGAALMEHLVRHHVVDYAIENRSGSPRTVMLDLPYVANAKVEGADSVDLDAGRHAVFQSGPRSKTVRRLQVDEGLERAVPIEPTDWRAVRKLSESPTLAAAQRPLLRAVADALMEADTRSRLVPQRQADLADMLGDVTRLRASAAALRGADPAQAKVIATRLVHAEDRVRALRQRIAELGVEQQAFAERARAGLARLKR